MKSYIAQRQISHDNRLCQEGELLNLDDATAKPLLAIGAVIETQEEVKTVGGESGVENGDDSVGEVAALTTNDQGQESTAASMAKTESAVEVPSKVSKKTAPKAE